MSTLKGIFKSHGLDWWGKARSLWGSPSASLHEARLASRRARFITLWALLLGLPLGAWIFGEALKSQTLVLGEKLSTMAHMQVRNVMVDVRRGGTSVPQEEWNVDALDLRRVLPPLIGQGIFTIDPAEIRSRVASLSWIKKVSVRLELPDTVMIVMEERQPYAMWQVGGRFYLIDEDGAFITDKGIEKYGDLPWVVGEGANTAAKEYGALMGEFSVLQDKIKAAYRMGERRWVLKLYNDMEVKLSESDPRNSLMRLLDLENKYHILSRNIEVIDLRVPEKTYVRLPQEVKQLLTNTEKETPQKIAKTPQSSKPKKP